MVTNLFTCLGFGHSYHFLQYKFSAVSAWNPSVVSSFRVLWTYSCPYLTIASLMSLQLPISGVDMRQPCSNAFMALLAPDTPLSGTYTLSRRDLFNHAICGSVSSFPSRAAPWTWNASKNPSTTYNGRSSLIKSWSNPYITRSFGELGLSYFFVARSVRSLPW